MNPDAIIERPYTSDDVERLRGSVSIEHTLARLGAERLRRLLAEEPWVPALGAMTGGQAVQMVKAGLKAIYLSGWQVAADANLSGQDVSGPEPLPGEQRAGTREADQQRAAARRPDRPCRGRRLGSHWLAPIVADAEAGFGGPLNAYELMKVVDRGGRRAACTSRTSSRRRRSAATWAARCSCPTAQHVRTLVAARLAADVPGCRRSSSRAPTRSAPSC